MSFMWSIEPKPKANIFAYIFDGLLSYPYQSFELQFRWLPKSKRPEKVVFVNDSAQNVEVVLRLIKQFSDKQSGEPINR